MCPKTFVILIYVLFAPVCSIGQTADSSVSLNISLTPIQALVVHPQNGDTGYPVVEDTGAEPDDDLTIYSTNGFEIKAQIPSRVQHPAIPAADHKKNVLLISASEGTDPLPHGTVYTHRELSAKEQVIISSGTGGINKKIGVLYTSPESHAHQPEVMYTIISR